MLSFPQMSFVDRYSEYLSHKIKSNTYNKDFSLWMLSNVYDELKNWEITKIVRTTYFSPNLYSQWYFESSDFYCYLRASTGTIMLCQTERFFNLNYTPFRVIGLFIPPSRKFVLGTAEFEEYASLFGWRIKNGARDNFLT